jgi:hypothetical protein
VVDSVDADIFERLPDVLDGVGLTSQCIVTRKPSARARSKTAANLLGGLPRSSESRPTPMIRSFDVAGPGARI